MLYSNQVTINNDVFEKHGASWFLNYIKSISFPTEEEEAGLLDLGI